MAVANEPMTTPAPRVRWWRSIYLPLVVLIVCGVIFAAPWVCIAVGIDTNDIVPPPLILSQWIAPLIAWILIGFWWLFLSTYRWTTRFGVLAVLLVGVAGFVASVRSFELTKGRISLVPIFHFRWETTANERLAAYLANQGQGDDLPPIDAAVLPDDFPRYRGVNADGIVRLPGLQTDWKQHPPKELWSRPCPGGYSGIAVAGNIVVTLEQRDDGQTVVCCDRATGKQRWTHLLSASYVDKNNMGNGPRSTPTIHDNRIYCLGAGGTLACLNANGKERWLVNILSDSGAANMKWGLTSSPLIVDDLVIVNPGEDVTPDRRLHSAVIAYDAATGHIRWRTGTRKASYSSPQLVTIDGVPQILLFDGAGLVAYDKTGKELWNYEWITEYEMNSIQPVVFADGRIFISSEKTQGCAMVRVKGNAQGPWTVETVWKNNKLAARYANPVSDGKNIFGLHNLQGQLICIDAENGRVKWKGELEGPGQMLLTDGVLLVVNGDSGDVKLFDATASEARELARFDTFKDKRKTWNTPALAGDQLFVRNQNDIVCLKLPRR